MFDLLDCDDTLAVFSEECLLMGDFCAGDKCAAFLDIMGMDMFIMESAAKARIDVCLAIIPDRCFDMGGFSFDAIMDLQEDDNI